MTDAGPTTFTAQRPRYGGPWSFLAALGELGAHAVLVHEGGAVCLDFRVPSARAYRAAVIMGDPASWPEGEWADVVALAVMLSEGGAALLDGANDERRTVDLTALVRSTPREPGVVLPFRRKRRPRTSGPNSRRAGAREQRGGEHGW